jgi:hypothetical protein
MSKKWNYTKELALLYMGYDFYEKQLLQISETIEKLKADNGKELLKLGNRWLRKNKAKITHGSVL